MREYYIRREGDEDSSGPFDIDQISSLIEAGKLDASAFYYDIESENWLLISSNQEMMDALFPKKRKLSLRTEEREAEVRKEREAEAARQAAAHAAELEENKAIAGESPDMEGPALVHSPDNSRKAKIKREKQAEAEKPEKLDVTRMLAVAEGRAHDPGGKTPREKQAAAAFLSLRFLTLLFIASILAMAYLERDLVLSADALRMAKSPYLVIAAFDIVMTVFLLLQVTEVYPLLRFRAAVGAGLLTVLFYSSGDTVLLLSNLLIMAAIYFCSAIVRNRYLFGCIAVGTLGIVGYLYAFFLA